MGSTCAHFDGGGSFVSLLEGRPCFSCSSVWWVMKRVLVKPHVRISLTKARTSTLIAHVLWVDLLRALIVIGRTYVLCSSRGVLLMLCFLLFCCRALVWCLLVLSLFPDLIPNLL